MQPLSGADDGAYRFNVGVCAQYLTADVADPQLYVCRFMGFGGKLKEIGFRCDVPATVDACHTSLSTRYDRERCRV